MKELTEVNEGGGVAGAAGHAPFPNPSACGECHVAIYEEWSRSPHARAFASETFRRATDGYQFKECLGCHAPQPTLSEGRPAARASQHDLGVVCVSCHLKDGAMVGPKPPTGFVKPHPIAVMPALFADGAMCGRCHEGTLKQWNAAPAALRTRDCSVCHMPEVHRTMTQATGLLSRPIVAAETPGPEHRHSFDRVTAESVADSLALELKPADGRVDIRLTNGMPHALPTGDFGVRIIRIVATGTTGNGQIEPLAAWEIAGTADQPIPAGADRTWIAHTAPGLQNVEVEVLRQGRDESDRTLLLRKEVVLP